MSNIPYGDPGVAAFQSDEFGRIELTAGDTPAWADEVLTVAAGTGDLPLYSVVSVNGSGEVIPAVLGTSEAIGFTASAYVSAGGVLKVKVCRMAHVFIDALNWPASYNTDVKRLGAFRAAPAPTGIIVSKHPTVPAVV